MKRNSTVLLILFFVFGITTLIGQIPNNGFENWANDEDDQFNPVGWMTTNDDPYICATQYTPAYAGNYSLKLSTVDYGFAAIAGIAQVEFPFTERPNSLDFCIKTNVIPGDEVYVTCGLFIGDTIIAGPGDCTFVIDTTINEFTCLSLPITYGFDWYPTSATIMIIAGNSNAQVGTTIIIDEIKFAGTTGIGNTNSVSDNKIENFPNPAREFTYIPLNLSSESDVEVLILDMNGKAVQSIPYQSLQIGKNDLLVNTSQFVNGVYTYTVRSIDFNYFGKMIVCK